MDHSASSKFDELVAHEKNCEVTFRKDAIVRIQAERMKDLLLKKGLFCESCVLPRQSGPAAIALVH